MTDLIIPPSTRTLRQALFRVMQEKHRLVLTLTSDEEIDFILAGVLEDTLIGHARSTPNTAVILPLRHIIKMEITDV